MKKIWALGLLAVLLVSLLTPSTLAAPSIPKPTSAFYVLDQAEVLSSQTESTIVGTSQQLAAKTKAQVVVVTVKSLGGYSAEEYALALLRGWGIGDRELNNGVLILLAPNERKSRIEVGYGLEGALPDGKTGRIQDEFMLPYFKKGDFDQGILNGYLAVVGEIAKEYQVAIQVEKPRASPATSQTREPVPTWLCLLGVLGLLFLFYLDFRYLDGFLFGFLLGTLLRGGGGAGGRGNFGGGGSGGGGGSSRNW
ncbi:MAG: TPM domain-containing protein [Firmicutes bacterium]|nr:TPM domain-containing protein [Bacillota bacterium]